MEIRDYNWEEDCPGSSSKMGWPEDKEKENQQISSERSLTYQIIPNIYRGNKSGYVELGSDEEGFLEVYSSAGVLLKSDNLSGGMNSINLSGLTKGVFIYKIIVENEVKTNDKLVILE